MSEHRDLCLDVGENAGLPLAVVGRPAGHVRYWFDHVALTTDPDQPVVMWRRYDGDTARYLTPIPREKPADEPLRPAVRTEWTPYGQLK